MPMLESVPRERAPSSWGKPSTHTEIRLHQLAPYIGKLKSTIARDLIDRFTSPGDLVLDTFCGSGTIPLECVLRGRRAVAFDANPYAVTLTRAKLEAPASVADAMAALDARLAAASKRPATRMAEVPGWVRKFFHPSTLDNVIKFTNECIDRDDPFLLACLLGILHHQRPGFLSYPSSHLVPYLREKKFPRGTFPKLYEERTLEPRLRAKVRRAYRQAFSPGRWPDSSVERGEVGALRLASSVDAIITSPPYMNALDYIRDNRLRMWFLDHAVTDYSPEPTDKKAQFDVLSADFVKNALRYLRPGGRCVLIVGETVRRKRMTSHPAERMLTIIGNQVASFQLECVIEDNIPDVRRTRRETSATKKELVLVLRRRASQRDDRSFGVAEQC